jgi:hypothetical protein
MEKEILNREFDKVERMAFEIYLKKFEASGNQTTERRYMLTAFDMAKAFYNVEFDERESFINKSIKL